MAISSGERGTKSQQQDRRNAADRERAAGGGSGRSGERGTLGQQQDRRNLDTARRSGNAAPGVGANNNRGTLSQQQDRINTNRALARSNTAPGVGNYSKAMDDYNNIGQGFFDDPFGALGRFLGGGIGIGEIDPSTQAPKSFLGREQASWGIDPIGAALGLGGLAAGPIGTLASGLYNRGIKGLTGWQGPMIAFDGNQPVTGGFPSFGGFGGGTPQPGGGTGMANAGNMGQPQMGGVLAPQQTAQAPQVAPGGPAARSSIPSYPQFSWAQPWPGAQPQGGGSFWGQAPLQPQQQSQQSWSSGVMAPQPQSAWSSRGHTTGWR